MANRIASFIANHTPVKNPSADMTDEAIKNLIVQVTDIDWETFGKGVNGIVETFVEDLSVAAKEMNEAKYDQILDQLWSAEVPAGGLPEWKIVEDYLRDMYRMHALFEMDFSRIQPIWMEQFKDLEPEEENVQALNVSNMQICIGAMGRILRDKTVCILGTEENRAIVDAEVPSSVMCRAWTLMTSAARLGDHAQQQLQQAEMMKELQGAITSGKLKPAQDPFAGEAGASEAPLVNLH